MEFDYEVTSRSQLVAAIKAACRPSFEEARANPVTIKNGTTLLRFKAGIQESRAAEIIRQIKRTPERAFDAAH